MQVKPQEDIEKIIESLSPNERKILPYLKEGEMSKVSEKSRLDKTSALRALEFLSNKKIIILKPKQEKIIELGINGILYVKQGLPERKLINIISEKKSITLKEAKDKTNLNDNEFKAAIGALKKKALIELKEGKLNLLGSIEEISKKSLEEKFLESLPRNLDELAPEEKFAFENLKSRKNIIDIQDKKIIYFSLTELGEKLSKKDLSQAKDMIEVITPNLIKTGLWKGKKFRRYDITSPVPRIYGGKRHFFNQSADYAKRVWLDMGFKEMTGPLCVSGFWNFDVLFTAQDHPVRELHDTFFIKNKKATLPDKKLVEEVKKAHEGKIKGSKGWNYKWLEEPAKKVVLRTHTTCLSARTLVEIQKNNQFPSKYFALGRCFRNETVDQGHLFEFNQSEGIVIDENGNLQQLLGYLREFLNKMGFKKIRFRPHYFPYTEPSLEADVYDEKKGKWIEIVGAGIFRPEVTIPIFGRHIPVLAWGYGFDRLVTDNFQITDLRDIFGNNINKLREMKFW